MDAVKRGDYFAELGRHKRALIATSAGLASGFLLNHYVANLFAPHLIQEFGWSTAEFALIGSIGLVNLFAIPIVGRLTDLYGARPVALIGVIAYPLTFVGMSLQSGSLAMFTVLTMLQFLLCGATTSSTVYSRWVAERFVGARGLALAIAATSPALVGVVGSPLLAHVIDTQGWRTGYIAVGIFVAIVGTIAMLLAPPRKVADAGEKPERRKASRDYPAILRSPAFWVIAMGMLLCNLVYPLQSSQMKLMLLEAGMSSASATWMISLFAGGVVIGRFAGGVALDRFPAHVVAAIALGAPGVGLAALSAGVSDPYILAGSVLMLGMSLGAESDLIPYLVMRFFKIEVYGSVLGLVVTSMALAASLGAMLVGVTITLTGTFQLYMLLCAVAALAGGALFLTLGMARMAPRIEGAEATA